MIQGVGFDAGSAEERALRLREQRWHQMALAVFAMLALLAGFREWSIHGSTFAAWDWMLLSGLLLVFFGAIAAYPLPRRLDRMLVRLARRRVLVAKSIPIQQVTADLRRARRQWQFYGGLICAFAIAAAFAAVLIAQFSLGHLMLGVLETAIAFIVGRYLGAMAQSSMLSRVLTRHDVAVVVRPAALDGAGGLEPVGHFFFLQASVVSLPAAYISAWLLLIPLFPRYEGWLLPYCGLLTVALAFTVVAFLLPLWFFHRQMRSQKQVFAERADEIAQRINTLNDELLVAEDQETRRRLRSEIDAETRHYREIEAMPLWPIAPATRRRFTVNNTLLTFPLVGRLLEELGVGGDLLRWLGSQLSV